MYDAGDINGRESIRRARTYARRTGQVIRFDAAHGKGGHGRLYVGGRFTTVQRGELSKGMVAAKLRQLGIDPKEF